MHISGDYVNRIESIICASNLVFSVHGFIIVYSISALEVSEDEGKYLNRPPFYF